MKVEGKTGTDETKNKGASCPQSLSSASATERGPPAAVYVREAEALGAMAEQRCSRSCIYKLGRRRPNQPVENHTMLGIRRSRQVLIKGIITHLDFALPNFGSVPSDNKKGTESVQTVNFS